MKLINYFLILQLLSCATRGAVSKQTSLDIDESKRTENIAVKLADPSRPVTPQAIFNWQKIFKGPPPSKDRPAILKSIELQSSNDSIGDLLARGRNQLALGLLLDAEATLRQVLRKDAKNVEALIELSTVLTKRKRIDLAFEALSDAKDVLQQSEVSRSDLIFRYRYALAMAYLAKDDKANAHPILSDLVGKDRTFLPGYAALAFSYLKDGKDTVAKFIIEQALDRGGEHPSLYNILGLISDRQQDATKARSFFNKALSLNDAYAPALINRGNLYFTNNQIAMAEADYVKALAVDPSNTDGLIGLAAVYRQTGRYSAAKDKLNRVLDIDSSNPQARFNLAILMRDNLKDEGLALRYYSEVVQSDRAGNNLKTMAKAAIEEIRSL